MFNPIELPRLSSLNKFFMAFAGTGGVVDSLPRRTNFLDWKPKLVRRISGSGGGHHQGRRGFQPAVDAQAPNVPSEREGDLAAISDAMVSLPKDHRQILTMICIQGMRYAEVAEQLNIPVDTVRARLSRARNELQDFLDKDACGGPSPQRRQRS